MTISITTSMYATNEDIDYYKERLSDITTAERIFCNQFILCSDGSVIDILDEKRTIPYYIDNFIEDTLSEINSEHRIRTIKSWGTSYEVITYNGLYYTIDIPILLTEDDSPLSASELINVSEIGSIKSVVVNEEKQKFYTAQLLADGTVKCDFSPEISKWKDIDDIYAGGSFLIDKTKDGKVLSCGIDFAAENVVKIGGLYYNGDYFPVALTANETFVFPENHPMNSYKPVVEASKFTNIVDFVIVPSTGSEGCIILAQKSDESLIATTNIIYNPEYVSQPE